MLSWQLVVRGGSFDVTPTGSLLFHRGLDSPQRLPTHSRRRPSCSLWNKLPSFCVASNIAHCKHFLFVFLPLSGSTHLVFKDGDHYTWSKVTITVHNIIVGRLWAENSGETIIRNHRTQHKCHMRYDAHSYFSRDNDRRVSSTVSVSLRMSASLYPTQAHILIGQLGCPFYRLGIDWMLLLLQRLLIFLSRQNLMKLVEGGWNVLLPRRPPGFDSLSVHHRS